MSAPLTGLGARLADWEHYPADPGYVVLDDTEGNRFCIVDASHPAAGGGGGAAGRRPTLEPCKHR